MRAVGMALLLLLLAGCGMLATFETAAAQDIGACVQDLALQDSEPNNDNLQCTADDLTIAQYRVLNGVTSCVAGENITVDLQAEIVGGAQARYDIGLFVALDGGSGLTGLCARDFLTPTALFKSSAYSLTSGIGPFRNLENNGDLCGDVSQKETNLKNIRTLTLSCTDSNNDGMLDVGSCLSWDQQSNNTCVSLLGTIPGSNAKCRCEPMQVGTVIVRRVARLEVIKDIVPDGAAGFFNLNVTGSNAITDVNVQSLYSNGASNVGDNGSTGVLTIPVGSSILPGGRYTVTESAGTNTSLADYASSAACVYRVTGAPVAGGSASGTGPLSFNVQPGDDIVCTFTNRFNKGSLELRKVTDVPTSQWNLSASGPTPFSKIVTGSDTTGERAVLTGTYTIGEIGVGATSLADYDTTWACTVDGQPSISGNGGTASVTVHADQSVVCTFTNTRKSGSFVITKAAVGGDATFGFTGSGATVPDVFQITTSGGSGSVTYNNVPTGSYAVNEAGLPDGWDFSSLQCSDPSGNTTVDGTTASIEVEQNETVNCIFTNTRRGSITITKSVAYNGFEADPDVQQQQYTICVEGASVSYPVHCQNFLAGQSTTFGNLLPGSYSVYETAPTANEGWMITVSNATPTVLAGQDTAVIVSNMPVQGEILVIKSVHPRFVREYQWAITKTVDPPLLDLFVGDTGQVSYTLDIARSIRLERDFAISGTVAISNPSALPVWINQPVDVLSAGGSVALDCGVASWPQRIAAGTALLCTYDQVLGGVYTPAATITNTVSVSLTNNTLYQQAVPFSFSQPTVEIDDEVTLSDPVGGLAAQSVSGNLSIPYSKSPTCDTFSDWQNGGNSGSYTIVNTATLSGALADESDSTTVTVNCYRLGVSKSVQPSYALTTTWEISKTVDDPTVDIFAGDSQDVTYTVYVTRTGTYSGSWAVDGTILLANPAPLTATLSSIEDVLAGTYPGTVSNCSPSATRIVPFGQVTCDYTIDLSGAGAVDGSNVARAVLANNDGSTTHFTGSQAVDFATAQVTPIHSSVEIDDSAAGSIGSFSSTGAATYTRTLNCADVTGYASGLASRRVDNVATIVQTGQSDSESVALNCYIPSIGKDATPSYTITYTWQLEKLVFPAIVHLFDGANATLHYTVTATRDNGMPGSWGVTGIISVTNPHPTASIALTDAVVDVIEGGIDASVNCPARVGPGATVACTYAASLPDNTARQNTAALTLFGHSYSAYVDIDFAGVLPAEVNASLTVKDTYDQADSPWTFMNSGSQSYSRLVDCSSFVHEDYLAGSAGVTVVNTASATQESGEQLSSSAAVALTCYRPSVSKTAWPSYVMSYTWDITKTADVTQVALFDGDGQSVNYTIEAVKDGGTPGRWHVDGAVTVFNPNPSETIPLSALADQLSGGYGAVVLDCGNATEVPAAINGTSGSLTCTYTVALPDDASRTNTATVTLYGKSYSSSADIAFNVNEATLVNDSLTVTDTIAGPWTFDTSGIQSYQRYLTCADVFGQDDYGSDGTIRTDLPNTAVGRGDNDMLLDQDSEIVTLTCYRPLVSKDANTSYTRQYFWDIVKTVEPAAWDIFVGDQVTSTYAVTAFIVGQQDRAWQVDGTITISNPAPMAAKVIRVVDVLPNGVAASVDCTPSNTLAAHSAMTCRYSGQPGSAIVGNNVVTVTLETSAGSSEYVGTAPVLFGAPTTELGKTVAVTDSRVGSLGAFSDGQTKRYPTHFSCEGVVFGEDASSAGYTYSNTASIDGTGASADASVSVTCWKPPLVKTANTSYNRVFDYDIVKTADPLEQMIYYTDTATFGYTLQVTKFIREENGFAVGGTIEIANAAPIDAKLASIEDILPGSSNMTISCSPDSAAPYTVPAGGQLICTYSAGVPDKSFRINEARVTLDNGSVISDTADVNFEQALVTPINDAVDISDTYFSQVWSVSETTQTNYEQSFTCKGATYDEQTGFFRKVLNNTAAVLLPGGDTDSATVTLNCYQLGLGVQKTATPTKLPEPGGEFTFDVLVVNNSPIPVTLTSIGDSVYGDLTQVTGRMTGTTCALSRAPLAANGGQYRCRFTADVTGQPGFTETDVVTVSGQDAAGNSVSASADATVSITDTPSAITLTKTASQTELPWPGGDVIFTVMVNNVSTVDTVWIDSLIDSIYGDITQVAGTVLATTCRVPQRLAPSAQYSCRFVSNLTLPADATENLVETNVVTATGFDDEENPVEASDGETVTVYVAPTATIGDRVFVDINPDGINSAQKVAGNQQQDYDANGQPVESNVADIAVLLFAADGVLIAQTQTGADGGYQFTGVPPGNYYVVFVNDNVYLGVWTPYNAQIADDVNSDVDPMLPLAASARSIIDSLFGPGADAVRTLAFTVQPGQTYLDVDAGLIDLSGAGSVDISGLVWFDNNRDGVRQAEEVQRVPGIMVELYRVDDSQPNGIAQIDSMTTLADGSYAFTGLDAGIYFIKVTAPNNRISPQDAGSDDDIDSDVDPQSGESQPVLLNGAVVTLDIGVYRIPTALDTGDEPGTGTAQIYLPAVRR